MRVLLVEDNPGDARLVREALDEAMADQVRLDWVGRADEAVRRLDTDSGHDIILVDLSLPDSQGLETFRSIHAKAPRAAIIVLTGTGRRNNCHEGDRGRGARLSGEGPDHRRTARPGDALCDQP